jgi:hypothetical protein
LRCTTRNRAARRRGSEVEQDCVRECKESSASKPSVWEVVGELFRSHKIYSSRYRTGTVSIVAAHCQNEQENAFLWLWHQKNCNQADKQLGSSPENGIELDYTTHRYFSLPCLECTDNTSSHNSTQATHMQPAYGAHQIEARQTAIQHSAFPSSKPQCNYTRKHIYIVLYIERQSSLPA